MLPPDFISEIEWSLEEPAPHIIQDPLKQVIRVIKRDARWLIFFRETRIVWKQNLDSFRRVPINTKNYHIFELHVQRKCTTLCLISNTLNVIGPCLFTILFRRRPYETHLAVALGVLPIWPNKLQYLCFLQRTIRRVFDAIQACPNLFFKNIPILFKIAENNNNDNNTSIGSYQEHAIWGGYETISILCDPYQYSSIPFRNLTIIASNKIPYCVIGSVLMILFTISGNDGSTWISNQGTPPPPPYQMKICLVCLAADQRQLDLGMVLPRQLQSSSRFRVI